MKDDDLIAGRKCIMEFLLVGDWGTVMLRRVKHGLPLAKIGGRWEMSRRAYEAWKKRTMGDKPEGATASVV